MLLHIVFTDGDGSEQGYSILYNFHCVAITLLQFD